MKRLFSEVPKDVTKVTDEELADILARAEKAFELIENDDKEFLAGLSADEVIAQMKELGEGIMAMREETQKRVEDAERFQTEKTAIAATLKPKAEEDAGNGEGDGEGEGDGDGEGAGGEAEAAAEVVAEAEAATEEAVEESASEKVAALTADGSSETPAEEARRPLRRSAPVPAPAADRVVVTEDETDKALAFVASSSVKGTPPGKPFATKRELAEAVEAVMRAVRVNKSVHGVEEQVLVASLDYSDMFPEERTLRAGEGARNGEKLASIYEMLAGSSEAARALVASGGFCAPPENIYTMPQLAVQDRPVRDALPNFRATRGGINVPTPTTIGDADGAITVITAEEDAQGGTFATKSCLDMDCPDYTETFVTIISHCREFGNLNAAAWPEKITHENELTMAEHARIAESYLLGRIKTLAVNVTSGADTLGALIYLVDAIAKAKFGIRSRLRLSRDARFTALLPAVLGDILEVDTISTQFDRYKSLESLTAYLQSIGIDPYWYLDTPLQVGDATAAPGTSQIADSEQTAGALDAFPGNVQMALFPSGTLLHEDMAELNLGIVRDSTLNSTNDFQIFGETFENVALIGPQQALYWMTVDICPTGAFPPAGTVRSC